MPSSFTEGFSFADDPIHINVHERTEADAAEAHTIDDQGKDHFDGEHDDDGQAGVCV
jgi:hypothetical protein